MGAALLAMTGLASCVGDLDQMPKDPNTTTPGNFKDDPKKYLSEVMAKCLSLIHI